MRFSLVTIHPEIVQGGVLGVVARARKQGLVTIDAVNPRDFTHDKHRSVDDTPYGGGPGMVMRPEPLVAAIEAVAGVVEGEASPAGVRRILLSPGGARFDQAAARRLAGYSHLVLVCGRYEGVDQRAIDVAIDEEVSLGDFVLTGGELGALAIIDAVARLLPGVLGDQTSADDESFTHGLLEYPQYTRPVEFRGRGVPEILASGNHAAIARWRRLEAMARTQARRPDLWNRYLMPAADAKAASARGLDLPARTHLALVHHPILDREGGTVTTAVTNLDIHDIARSSSTYGLARYHLVTPIASQRDKAAQIAAMWIADQNRQHRAQALGLVAVHPSLDAVRAELMEQAAPWVVATTARSDGFPGVPRVDAAEVVRTMAEKPDRPLLLVFGTGWGLVDSAFPYVDQVLNPVRGTPEWNHLSVRSAVAIVLDRLFGVPIR